MKPKRRTFDQEDQLQKSLPVGCAPRYNNSTFTSKANDLYILFGRGAWPPNMVRNLFHSFFWNRTLNYWQHRSNFCLHFLVFVMFFYYCICRRNYRFYGLYIFPFREFFYLNFAMGYEGVYTLISVWTFVNLLYHIHTAIIFFSIEQIAKFLEDRLHI